MNPHFTIVICSRNDSAKQVERCLKAALSQDYPDYAVMWMDDCSDTHAKGEGEAQFEVAWNSMKGMPKHPDPAPLVYDHTSDVWLRYGGPNGDETKDVWIGSSRSREYALKHYVDIIRLAERHHPGTIILSHGGDDCLAGPHALSRIAKEYEAGAWFTYGQYKHFPSNKMGRCVPFEAGVLEERMVRSKPFISMHPTTFYAKLFLKIREEDLKINGRWVDTAADAYFHFPMLEMCASPERVRLIEDVLYYYQEQDPKRFMSEEYALQVFMTWNARHKGRYSKIETLDDVPKIEKRDSSDWACIFQTRDRCYDAKIATQTVGGEEPAKPEEMPVNGIVAAFRERHLMCSMFGDTVKSHGSECQHKEEYGPPEA